MNNAFGPKKPMVVGLQFTASGVRKKRRRDRTVLADQGKVVPRQDGNAKSGQEVFRHETFGNEGFWTGAARAPQGMTAAHVTPMQAMQLGLSVNVDALDESTKKDLAADLKKDPTGRSSALLNDPSTTGKLLNANALIGLTVKTATVTAS